MSHWQYAIFIAYKINCSVIERHVVFVQLKEKTLHRMITNIPWLQNTLIFFTSEIICSVFPKYLKWFTFSKGLLSIPMLWYVLVHWLIERRYISENSKFHILSLAKQLIRFEASYCINLLMPNVNYSWRTAPLTSKVAFIYLFNKYRYWIF